MAMGAYRFISSSSETTQIIKERKIHSTNASSGYLTFYTVDRYNNENEAQRYLALPNLPTHRVGPISLNDIPNLAIPMRTVIPQFGQPGLGTEFATLDPVWILGLFDFSSLDWDL